LFAHPTSNFLKTLNVSQCTVNDGLKPKWALRVLYIFAGRERQCDVHSHLLELQQVFNFQLSMKEIDILRDPTHDITDSKLVNSLLREIDSLHFDVVIVTPPCNTFSRARSSSSPGPKPLRSAQFPWGFPWLEGKRYTDCSSGNYFVKVSWKMMEHAWAVSIPFFMEHPEDLGVTSTGQHPGSVWQFPEQRQLLTDTGASTWAVYQCKFGASSPKPTRFFSNLREAPKQDCQGWPIFDAKGRYKGPLPKHCGHTSHAGRLVGLDNEGAFKTAAAAAYPPELCRYIAYLVVDSLNPASLKGGEQAEEGLESTVGLAEGLTEVTSDEDEDGVPRVRHFAHSIGDPIKTDWGGETAILQDGFGLCSPLRWHPSSRGMLLRDTAKEFCRELSNVLEDFCRQHFKDPGKLVLSMALGKVTNMPFSDKDLENLRNKWFSLLPSPTQASEVPEFQPFYLRAIGQSLMLLDDPDWRILATSKESFASGVRVGCNEKMPRTPAVFARKTKRRKYDDTELILEMKNYPTAEQASADLQRQYEEEEKLGMMFPLSLKTARKQFPGDRLRIAAQGAIPKPDGTFRPIHDGTHGVRVNNDITVRDQLAFPGPADEAALLTISKEDSWGVVISLASDIKKAHRRVKHRPQDWGLMACRVSDESDTVWINRVGTFGIGSIAYWWGRLAAAMGRLVGHVCQQELLWMTIFADDIKVSSGGSRKYWVILKVYTLWLAMGSPFAWSKFRGGLEIDFVGYWLDYARFEMGLSESRTIWLIQWLQDLSGQNPMLIRRAIEGLGRLAFAARVLYWLKPFLAPIYAWTNAVPPGSVLAPPPMVRLVAKFMNLSLSGGKKRIACSRPERPMGEWFRTDAKGETEAVVLGGWELNGDLDTKQCRWFSIKLTPKDIPWAFKESGSSWASTAIELLAVLVALKLFSPSNKSLERRSTEVIIKAGTDNQAAEFLSKKGASTKMPVMLVLMQLATTSSEHMLRLDLKWRPRSENQPADDLTNGDFTKFSGENRIEANWEDLDFKFLAELASFKVAFEEELEAQKALKRQTLGQQSSSSKRQKFEKSSW
jgi:hypothetical protein